MITSIVFPDHRRLKPAKGYAFQRRLRRLHEDCDSGTMQWLDLNIRILAWAAHVKHGDTYGLRRAILSAEGLYHE